MAIKHLSFIVLLVFGLQSLSAQKIDLKIDYTISYFIEKSKDTIEISIGENGKYLYTDSKLIVNQIRKELRSFPGMANNEEADIKFLLNTADMEMLFYLNSGKTSFLMNLDLSDIVPKNDTVIDKTTAMLAQKSAENISLVNKSFPLYHVYPDDDPEDKLLFAFDENYKIDYGQNFSNMLSLILKSDVTIDFPEGIILYIKDKKGEEVIKAIAIFNESRTISVDMNFHINKL